MNTRMRHVDIAKGIAMICIILINGVTKTSCTAFHHAAYRSGFPMPDAQQHLQ